MRRISAASNAIQTIDNEANHLIIYCLNCIRHGRNATYEPGLSFFRNSVFPLHVIQLPKSLKFIDHFRFVLVGTSYHLPIKVFYFPCPQGDYGGPLGLKKNFVTFQKAKLICSDGADFPLNFNELRE